MHPNVFIHLLRGYKKAFLLCGQKRWFVLQGKHCKKLELK